VAPRAVATTAGSAYDLLVDSAKKSVTMRRFEGGRTVAPYERPRLSSSFHALRLATRFVSSGREATVRRRRAVALHCVAKTGTLPGGPVHATSAPSIPISASVDGSDFSPSTRTVSTWHPHGSDQSSKSMTESWATGS